MGKCCLNYSVICSHLQLYFNIIIIIITYGSSIQVNTINFSTLEAIHLLLAKIKCFCFEEGGGTEREEKSLHCEFDWNLKNQ